MVIIICGTFQAAIAGMIMMHNRIALHLKQSRTIGSKPIMRRVGCIGYHTHRVEHLDALRLEFFRHIISPTIPIIHHHVWRILMLHSPSTAIHHIERITRIAHAIGAVHDWTADGVRCLA